MKKEIVLAANCRLMPSYQQTLASLSLMFKLRAFKELSLSPYPNADGIIETIALQTPITSNLETNWRLK
jgi:hypothetical protein